MGIKENLEVIYEKIRNAAERSGRKAEDIKLLAATKYSEVYEIKNAINCGINIIGENRVQEADLKFLRLPEVEKHMIGHLQSNKAKLAVRLFDTIQTIDSLKIANEINKRAFEMNKIMPVFIEVNISEEETKYGLSLEEIPGLYDKMTKMLNLRIKGLMTIAPNLEPEETRHYFRQVRETAGLLSLKELSMGMSNDFEVAIEEGSTIVRIGRSIFS